MGERGIYRVSVGKHEEKRPLGRARRKWEDNIKIELQEVGCGCMDWIELAQDMDRWRTLVNAVNPHIRFTAWCKNRPLPIAICVSVSQLRGPGQLSRYSESLQAGWSGDQILMRTRNSTTVQSGPVARPISCTMGNVFIS